MSQSSKGRFDLKGKNAEKFVHDLAVKTFLVDWCYLNPKLPNGKELCDLLVVYDDTVVIWQVKDLQVDEAGRYRDREVAKNLRQLSGARRQLVSLKTAVELENPRRRKEFLDAASIKEIYLISVLLGEGEDAFSFLIRFRDYNVHVFNKDFTQLVLGELDTVSDFVRYLRAKEILKRDKHVIVVGGEEELLAWYLMNDRSFDRFKEANAVLLDQGSWQQFRLSQKYRNKKEEDQISYGWDDIINRVHEASPEYEVVARELARPDRFERRVLAKAYYDAYVLADKDKTHNLFRRTCALNGVTYCFLFADDTRPREFRKAMLESMCYIARGKFKSNRKVIGIATEKRASSICSYDFALLNMPEWTEQNEREMAKLQGRSRILVSPEISVLNEEEYPA